MLTKFGSGHFTLILILLQSACTLDADYSALLSAADAQSATSSDDDSQSTQSTDTYYIIRSSNSVNCVIANGELFCVGVAIANGQVGSTETFEPIFDNSGNPLTDVVDFMVNEEGGCAIVGDEREVYCWGKQEYIADNNPVDVLALERAYPVKVPTGTNLVNVREIAVGSNHACALRGQKDVTCWGSNSHEQLGVDGIVTDTDAALKITAPLVNTTRIHKIVAQLRATCFLSTDSSVGDDVIRCFGDRAGGRLGDDGPVVGTEEVPQYVKEGGATVTGMIDFDLNSFGGCFLKNTGANSRTSCWGFQTGAVMGKSAVAFGVYDEATLTHASLESSSTIAISDFSVCVRNRLGTGMECWGYHNYEQNMESNKLPYVANMTTCTDPGVHGSPPQCSVTPTKAINAAGTATLIDVDQATLTNQYGCILKRSEDKIMCFGNNDYHIGGGGRFGVPLAEIPHTDPTGPTVYSEFRLDTL